MKDLTFLRKQSLDIYNRILSISEDISFINVVRDNYPDYPIIPNLRCGAWYVDPELSAGQFAYFKSTDGHFNNWSFNLRRPNFHLLSILEHNRGLIIVDSTRAGKRLPDALSKTVPIWCAVVNRALNQIHPQPIDPKWDLNLYTPPGIVSPQEHDQIEQHIDAWAHSLVISSYTLPRLELPLRPVWITPSSKSFPCISDQTCIPIICVSASKQVHEGMERRSNGYSYVQGSGDDHELWGMGLTPEIFWTHKSSILNTTRDDFEDHIKSLVTESKSTQTQHKMPMWIPISKVHGRVLLASMSDIHSALSSTSLPPPSESGSKGTAYVLIGTRQSADEVSSASHETTDQNILRLLLPEQISSHANFLLYNILPASIPFICHHLSNHRRICIACPTGKDLSVGIAVVALQHFFDDNGNYTYSDNNKADKHTIRTRLHWIITSHPQANPSRSTLKRVNEFLMSNNYTTYRTASIDQ